MKAPHFDIGKMFRADRFCPFRLVLLFSIGICCTSCTQQETQQTDYLFQTISAESSGIDFSNDLIETENFNIVDYLYFYNGGGVAVGDINNDGLPDIYFSANQKDNKLYLNKGNWQFEDITPTAGVAAAGDWKTGVVMVDINNDGLLDLYVCQLGDYKGIKGRNLLYVNNGDLTFTEKAAEYGLDFSGFSTHAAFFDYDNDGDLDVYLLNHSVHTKRSYGKSTLRMDIDSLAGDRLLRNDDGKYVDVTQQAGIFSSHIGYGLAIGLSDVNMDGFTDIYISNDFHENDYLYINNGNGTFTESISGRIKHTSRSSMGNDIADINNDGWPDIISLDMLPEDEIVLKRSAGEDPYEIYQLKLSFGYEKQFARNTLQLNMGNGHFSEIGLLAGVAATDWSWSSLFADFDNDGLNDLFISNGIVKRPNDMDYINYISDRNVADGLVNNPNLTDIQIASKMPEGKVHNYFFRNKGDLTFEDVSGSWHFAENTFSNGAAYADLDNDGDLDLVVNNINGRAMLMRNMTRENDTLGRSNHIAISLKGNNANIDGIGAKIYVYTGEKGRLTEQFVGRGYQSSVDKKQVIGIGEAKSIDSIRVIWPGGNTQLITDISPNTHLQLDFKDATDKYSYVKSIRSQLMVLAKAHLDFEHIENNFTDYNREYMIPHLMSREGPKVAVGDVNGDGLDDIYIGGATYNSGMLYLQQVNGSFARQSEKMWMDVAAYEEVANIFFDADGDGDLDLYIVSAGNEFQSSHPLVKDRLFINDGKGNFALMIDALPDEMQHGSTVAAADFDGDGDIDLFVGGGVLPGMYGIVPRSALLINDGTGRFTDHTSAVAPALQFCGMVKDAAWTDINNDGWVDLVVVGEWMPIMVFINTKGQLVNGNIADFEKSNGWWNRVVAEDMDGDGDVDLIVGNLGLNSKLKPSLDSPVRIYVNDFDQNQSVDQLITYTTNGKEFPVASRDELIKRMPIFKKNYVLHKDYAGKTIQEIIGQKGLESSVKRIAYTFETAYIENKGNGAFEIKPMPLLAQLSTVEAIAVADINGDGVKDIILGGNRDGVSPYFGSYDAGKGLVMLGDGKGNFAPLWPQQSGLMIEGDVRDIKQIQTKEGISFIFSRNNDKPLMYRLAP